MQRPWGGNEPSTTEKREDSETSVQRVGGAQCEMTLENRAEVRPRGPGTQEGIWVPFQVWGTCRCRAPSEQLSDKACFLSHHCGAWGGGGRGELGSHVRAAREAQGEG